MENFEKQKRPEIRVVGGAPEKAKEEHKRLISSRFSEHLKNQSKEALEDLSKYELEKTEEQVKMIERANEETNLLIKKIGLEPFDVSPDNIHILDVGAREELGYESNLNAKSFWHQQGILLFSEDLQNNPIYFTTVVFHELLHLKGYVAVESEGIGDGREPYHLGLNVFSSMKKMKEKTEHVHFNGLDEAVVAYAERMASDVFIHDEMFQEETDWMNSSGARKIKVEYAKKYNYPEEDVFLFAKKNTRRVEDTLLGIESMKIEASSYSYPKQVELFRYLISEIQSEFSQKYKNKGEVFYEFMRSSFTGQLLPIARIVEKTFGEGSFRSLGEMTNEPRSAVLKLETFKRLRSKFLREKEGKKE